MSRVRASTVRYYIRRQIAIYARETPANPRCRKWMRRKIIKLRITRTLRACLPVIMRNDNPTDHEVNRLLLLPFLLPPTQLGNQGHVYKSIRKERKRLNITDLYSEESIRASRITGTFIPIMIAEITTGAKRRLRHPLAFFFRVISLDSLSNDQVTWGILYNTDKKLHIMARYARNYNQKFEANASFFFRLMNLALSCTTSSVSPRSRLSPIQARKHTPFTAQVHVLSWSACCCCYCCCCSLLIVSEKLQVLVINHSRPKTVTSDDVLRCVAIQFARARPPRVSHEYLSVSTDVCLSLFYATTVRTVYTCAVRERRIRRMQRYCATRGTSTRTSRGD